MSETTSKFLFHFIQKPKNCSLTYIQLGFAALIFSKKKLTLKIRVEDVIFILLKIHCKFGIKTN